MSSITSAWAAIAAAVALDCVIDVQTLFLPIMAAVVVVSAGSVVLRRAGR
jgi:hypothetical protein